jgi:hypothetical protein
MKASNTMGLVATALLTLSGIASSEPPNTAAIVLSVHGKVVVGASTATGSLAHQLKLLDVVLTGQTVDVYPGAEVVLSFKIGGSRLKLDKPQKVVVEPNGLKGHPMVASSKVGVAIPIGEVDTSTMGGVSGRALARVYTPSVRPQIDLANLPETVLKKLKNPLPTVAYIRTPSDKAWEKIEIKSSQKADGRTTFEPVDNLSRGKSYDLNLEEQPEAGGTPQFYVWVSPANAMKDYPELKKRADAPGASAADRIGLIEYLLYYRFYDDALAELSKVPKGQLEADRRAELEAKLVKDRAAYNSGVAK